MDSNNSAKLNAEGVYKIQDAGMVFGNYLAIGALLLLAMPFAYFALKTLFRFDLANFAIWIILLGLDLLLILFFYAKANSARRGYIIDVPRNLFIYPGGKVADNFEDYLDINFWKQRLSLSSVQQSVPLSEIVSIRSENDRTWNKQTSQYEEFYNITIEGSFGSIGAGFGSKAKRDQLYSLLSQVLQMGEPIVVR